MPWPWSDPIEKLADDLERSWGLSTATALSAARLLTWLAYYRIPAQITSGYRSPERQKFLYETRIGVAAGAPVAKPGTSKHERRTAFDLDFPLRYWQAVEYLAAQAGLRWGGRFSRPDYVHFES